MAIAGQNCLKVATTVPQFPALKCRDNRIKMLTIAYTLFLETSTAPTSSQVLIDNFIGEFW